MTESTTKKGVIVYPDEQTPKDVPFRFSEQDGIRPEFERDGAKSITNSIPFRNYVVVKGVFNIVGLALINVLEGKAKPEPSEQYVVGVGSAITDLKIGDRINISFSAMIQPVGIKNNLLTINNVADLYKTGFSKQIDKIDKQYVGRSYQCVEYFAVPVANVVSIFNDED